jgi:hypothetical protein
LTPHLTKVVLKVTSNTAELSSSDGRVTVINYPTLAHLIQMGKWIGKTSPSLALARKVFWEY